MVADAIDQARAETSWKRLVAIAPTLANEYEVMGDRGGLIPVTKIRRVTMSAVGMRKGQPGWIIDRPRRWCSRSTPRRQGAAQVADLVERDRRRRPSEPTRHAPTTRKPQPDKEDRCRPDSIASTVCCSSSTTARNTSGPMSRPAPATTGLRWTSRPRHPRRILTTEAAPPSPQVDRTAPGGAGHRVLRRLASRRPRAHRRQLQGGHTWTLTSTT